MQMQELDDMALLRQYTEQNSEEAFAVLVARHVNKVYSVALRHTRNLHSAEEITQAVFIILAKKSGQLGRKVVVSGWLYETARLTAATFIRSEIRRARREQEAHMQTLLNENDAEAWPQIAPLLEAAMARLSETDRHAVVLRFFDGKSVREVGTALGVSEDAAKMRLNRAMEKLRGFFTKRGIAFSSMALAGTISANSVQAAPVALAKSVTAMAVAKGASASGSTLTLIQGALKIMAWTKMKTGIVVGVAVILAATAGTLVIQAINRPQPKVEKMIQQSAAAPPQVHIKAYFIKEPESEVPSIFKAGTVVDTQEGNIVEIMSPAQTLSLLRGSKSSGAMTLSKPEMTTMSGRQTRMSGGDTGVDVLSTLLDDGYTLKMRIAVSAPENLLAKVNTWDGQAVVLAPNNSSDGKTRLLVLVTSTLIDAAGNRIHSKNELPPNSSPIPPQE